jgi:ketosteroid isomerase-like protein
MSERDVQVAREALDAYNAMDVQRVLSFLDPECEMLMLRSLLDGTPYHGHTAALQFFRDMADEWTSWRIEPEEFRDLGEGRVLLLANFKGRARASGNEVSSPAAWLIELRGELIYHVRAFTDRAASLEYLGLKV